MREHEKGNRPKSSKVRGLREYIILYLKGIAMGSADVVPGVSGGTIALLTGVYEELVNSIRNTGSNALIWVFKRGGLRQYWRHIHGDFLLFLAAGIATAILVLSGAIVYLMERYPILVWSFFFGLILASIWFVSTTIKRWSWQTVGFLALGVIAGYLVSTSSTASLPDSPLYYFITGGIGICALILPGISGSFILVILGKYKMLMAAVQGMDLGVLLPFGFGALVGLLAFSHLLSWLLKRFHTATLAILTGFMGGAIVRVWPWQIASGTDGSSTILVTPSQYATEMGNAFLAQAICLIALGLVVVIGLELLSRKRTGTK